MIRRLALAGLLCLLAACATASRLDAANDVHALLVAIRDDDRAAFDARVDREALKAEMTARLSREAGRLNVEGLDLGRSKVVAFGMTRRRGMEAAAVSAELGATPVTAPKGSFGNLGAGSGAVELAASVLGLTAGLVPPTVNYEAPDPACPVNVVHGEPLAGRPATAVKVNLCSTGQAVAVALRAVS
jgi:3-oxoacyl-(acyl-carrier-protein) synthase